MRAAIIGLAGPDLLPHEKVWLRTMPPCGVILFKRNIVDPQQLARLMDDIRAVLPAEAVLMVDQEGGRVARLRPPHWLNHPSAGRVGRLFDQDPEAGERTAWLSGALIGLECRVAGFDVVCAPVLDRHIAGADDIVGDRAFAAEPEGVARLAGAMAAGLLAAGVQPVGKHAPGHGRATCDSHAALPQVTCQTDADLTPFQRLAPMLGWMMTAHILFPQWDGAHPATQSVAIVQDIIRERIGFGGVLVSDDLAMGALQGPPAARALAALAAGCDVALYCAGDAEQTGAVLTAVPHLTDAARARLQRAAAQAEAARVPLDPAQLAAERNRLLA